jgi:hypothetical protein
MVYNTQNYWVFGLCSSSGILKPRTQRFENWIYFRPQVRGHQTQQSRCPPPHLRTETDSVSESLCALGFRIPDDG